MRVALIPMSPYHPLNRAKSNPTSSQCRVLICCDTRHSGIHNPRNLPPYLMHETRWICKALCLLLTQSRHEQGHIQGVLNHALVPASPPKTPPANTKKPRTKVQGFLILLSRRGPMLRRHLLERPRLRRLPLLPRQLLQRRQQLSPLRPHRALSLLLRGERLSQRRVDGAARSWRS